MYCVPTPQLIGAAAVAIGIWQLVDNREYETLTGDE